MWKYTEDHLKTWGFENLISAFRGKNLTLDVLEVVTLNELGDLIPDIAWRSAFWRNFQSWHEDCKKMENSCHSSPLVNFRKDILAPKIIEAGSKKVLKNDPVARDRIKEILAAVLLGDEINMAECALLLVPYMIKLTPVKKRKGLATVWHPSRSETAEGFITHIKSSGELLESMRVRREKLANLKVNGQPYIVLCGDIGSYDCAYVVVENDTYNFPSLISAFTMAFQIFFATGGEYPQESADIWLFFQMNCFNVKTVWDRPSGGLISFERSIGIVNHND